MLRRASVAPALVCVALLSACLSGCKGDPITTDFGASSGTGEPLIQISNTPDGDQRITVNLPLGGPVGSPLNCSGDRNSPTNKGEDTWLLAVDGAKTGAMMIANTTTGELRMSIQGGFAFNYVFQGSDASARIYLQRLYQTSKTMIAPNAAGTALVAKDGSAQEWSLTPVAGRPMTYTIRSTDRRYAWSLGADGVTVSADSAKAAPVTLVARIIADGSWSAPIWAGEAQVSYACTDTLGNRTNSGQFVLNTGNAYVDLAHDTYKRIRLGCDTVAMAYPEENYAGTPTLLTADVDCNNNTKPFRSLRLMRAHDYALQNNGCAGCDMSGVNLQNINFANMKFENVRFAGSNLTGATFAGSTLKKAAFNSASTRLNGANFTGTTLEATVFDRATVADANFSKALFKASQLTNVDLTKANLTGADYELYNKQTPRTPDCSAGAQAPTQLCTALPSDPNLVCATTFRGTAILASQLPVVNWPKVDLSGVKFNWTGSKLENANLCAMKLEEVAFDRASLGGTKFDNANLSRSTFRYSDLAFSSFVNAIVKGTSFAYADLKSVNFEGAVGDGTLSGVNFNGSIFQVANIKKAGFAGADFSNASILMPKDPDMRSVKSLQSAKFSNANFNGSDLSDLELTGGNFDGANFSKTILNGTKLGRSDDRASTFLGAVFCGARVKAADISGANLSGALMPRKPSNALKNADTGAALECAAVVLEGATQIEDAISTIPSTCPDTSSAHNSGCQGEQWDLLGKVERAVCPLPIPGQFGPPKIRSCFACKTNCECATERCINNICAGDCPSS